MTTTRREAMGMMGAVAATVMISKGATGTEKNLGSSSKTLFWVASVTPCDKNNRFDPGAFRDILAWLKHNGAEGIVVLGTTGEGPSFSIAERKQVAEVALKDKHGLNIIVASGSSNFPDTLDLSLHAEANGADGLLVVPPFYYKNPPAEGLRRYFSMLFDHVRVAINLYHIPQITGVPITHELLSSLQHYPNLAGIKDSNGLADEYAEYVRSFPDLNMRTGTENNIEYALEHRMGAICMDGNLFTRALADVFVAFRAGKDYHAPYRRYVAMRQKMENMQTGIDGYGAMKYALSLQMGGLQTYQRVPNIDVTDAQKLAIKKGLEQIRR
jgi:4-hydroxy-tetrahydrodipicolinate synthase